MEKTEVTTIDDRDIARDGWALITIAAAWTLYRMGVKLTPEVVEHAREHALLHLPRRLPANHGADRTLALTERFVQRARGRSADDPWEQDRSMPLSPRWHRALVSSSDTPGSLVLRLHYGDGLSLDDIAAQHNIERLHLEGARGGLREMVRRAAVRDGLPLSDWCAERLDRLIQRLAAWSPGPCPPMEEVLEGSHREHVTDCPSCSRGLRLVRGGLLEPAALRAPTTPMRMPVVRLVVLHLHPDAPISRAALLRTCPVSCAPVDRDLLLVDFEDPVTVERWLHLATEVARPEAHHLRGVLLDGAGRFCKHGLLGPLSDRARIALRSQPWGAVEGTTSLPDPLPAPPPARRGWGVVAALSLVAAMLLPGAWDRTEPSQHGLQAEFAPGRGGLWATFDVDEDASVSIVRLSEQGELELLHAGTSPGEKMDWTVGDGRYRLHTPGDGLLLVAHTSPLDRLGAVLAAADPASPLEDVALRLTRTHPDVDVRLAQR